MLAAGLSALGCGTRVSQPTPAGPSWREIQTPPVPAASIIEGAKLASAADDTYVAVTQRSATSTGPSEVLVYRLGPQGAWTGPVGGRPLQVNRDRRALLLGGRRLCLAREIGYRAEVVCLDRSDQWEPLGGGAAFPTSGPSADVGLAAAIQKADGTVQLVQRFPSATGQPRHTVVELRDGRWSQTTPQGLDPRGAITQRPMPFLRGDTTCIAFDTFASAATSRSTISATCRQTTGWRPGAIPSLAASALGNRSRPIVFNVDGTAAVDDDIFLGVDAFRSKTTDWQVLKLEGTRWSPLAADAQDPGWAAQGSLYNVNGELWAVRFDQRTTNAASAQIKLVALRLQSGRLTQVGAPLAESAASTGPLYWDLMGLDNGVIAVTTSSERGGAENALHVLRLDP